MASTSGERGATVERSAAAATAEVAGEPTDAIVTVERVVVIGSSAGGLEALSALLASLSPKSPVAYVVAQHMSPDHDSQLVSLLSRATSMHVRVATDGAPLLAGSVMVAPPNTDLHVHANSLGLSVPGAPSGPKPSIDVAMRSAAQSWGERAVGIVLSGTGIDGSAGLRTIRDKGGLTIAQQPESAQFDAMPRAAIATGAVDLILAPGEVGAALARTPVVLNSAGTAADVVQAADQHAPIPGGDDAVADIIVALHYSTGLDFSDYKRSTLERQIGRRQVLVEVPDPATYCALIGKGGDEAAALARSLLVTVTSFFRDPLAWEALTEVLRASWLGRDARRQIRVWVPGCATGEEAYTVAMIAADVLGAGADLADRLKVFATDLSDSALDIARRGHYSDDATATIPPRLREHWMRRGTNDWEVLPALRDAVIFARHNVAQDPPFPRIDLVSLRNTLIYFNQPLQARVLGFCQFALAPGGLLFLGESERPSGPAGLFDVLDDQHRIYRRSVNVFPAPLPVPVPESIPILRRGRLAPLSDDRVVLRDALVDQFTPPALVVDANDDVIEVVGDVSPWCWVAPGEPSAHVVALLRAELRAAVQSLLIRARHGGAEQGVRTLMADDGSARLEVRRIGPADSDWVLLTFTPVEVEVATRVRSEPRDEDGDGELALVRQELDYTRSALQSTVEDLSASNEELRAMNEELQASAEELQASTEEVQATNEELQATNEELSTLNQELRVRGTDLATINARLESIQGSLISGMVVVDRKLCVTQFTPLAVRLFVLISDDLGRPLNAIATTVPVPDLERHLRDSMDRGTRSMLELSGGSKDFLVQFQPYVQGGPVSSGAIVVVTDVTELMTARREAQRALVDLAVVTDSLREVVWQRDHNGRLLFINAAVERVYGFDREAVVADPRLLVAAVHPDDRDRLDLAAAAATAADRQDLQYRIVRTDGEVRWVQESSLAVAAYGGRPDSVVTTLLDITQLREVTGELASRVRFDQQTGTLTRGHFREDLATALALVRHATRTLAVLWLNIDDFKAINGHHGHRAGDTVLLEVASRMQRVARRPESVGRLGGDEFAMLLRGASSAEAVESVARELMDVIRAPILTEEGPLFVTASVGIAVGPADGGDADALLHSADTAMYVAKAAGRDTFTFFQASMNKAAEQRSVAREQLAAAIRSREFVLHYQPIVDLVTGKLVMAEALVRWNRDGAVVAAGDFIEIAQDAGLLRALGRIVFDLLEADLVRIDASAELSGLRVAVNVSPDELEERDLISRLLKWNPSGGFERLVFEITESAVLSKGERAAEALTLIRRLGGTIAIDDYGTGFSNMRRLDQLQPNILKVDRSLLVDAEAGSRSREILNSAIQLGHALESQVVIEGIETKDELAAAVALHADYGQGYLLARPMPLADLLAWEPSA
ncbi:MAG: EAL domain-containing protein [Actinomycetes bacterium]